MSLNNLRIPGLLVSELYKNQLIDPEKPVKKTKSAKNAVPDADAVQEVLVLLHEPEAGVVSSVSADFITKILAACKWSAKNTTIINLNGNGATWNDLKERGIPRICLLFGPDATAIDLPVIFPEFRVHQFDQTKFLCCPSPEKMGKDQLLKSKLWLCMKELFNV